MKTFTIEASWILLALSAHGEGKQFAKPWAFTRWKSTTWLIVRQ